MAKLKFKFKITLVPGIRVTTFRINSTVFNTESIDESQSPTTLSTFEGELEAICIKDTVVVSLWGVGSPFLSGSFNITQNGKNLFSTDETFTVQSGGRFRFYKPEVKLP